MRLQTKRTFGQLPMVTVHPKEYGKKMLPRLKETWRRVKALADTGVDMKELNRRDNARRARECYTRERDEAQEKLDRLKEEGVTND